MKCLPRVATLIFVILALASIGFAQTSSTSLQGEITDPSGSAVPGATVVLDHSDYSRQIPKGVVTTARMNFEKKANSQHSLHHTGWTATRILRTTTRYFC